MHLGDRAVPVQACEKALPKREAQVRADAALGGNEISPLIAAEQERVRVRVAHGHLRIL